MVGKKILVAYYSYSGNTQEVAEAIHEAVGGDLFEIKTTGSYPESYRPMTEQAKKEIEAGYRPELTTRVENMAQYDVVFLGSPNWWGTITPQVSSFLEAYDLSGKTVIPFCTYGATYRDETLAKIVELTPDAKHLKGFGAVSRDTKGITEWLKEIQLLK